MKKTIINKLTVAIWIALVGICSFSCSDDEKTEATSIQLSANTITINKVGLTEKGEIPSVSVYSNKYWTLRFDTEVSWLEADLIAGAGETEISFIASENFSTATRSVSLTLESMDGTTAQLVITQKDNSDVVYHLQENMGTEEASNVNILIYDHWQQNGIGALVTKYNGIEALVDKESPSSGYETASGGNNILFPTSGAEFSFGKVATKDSSYFKLSFGVMSTSQFDPALFKLYVSNDNSLWVEQEYTRNANAGWAQAESKFRATSTPNLYFKFVSTADEVYRLDDILLEMDETRSGKEILFEKPEAIITALFSFDEDKKEWIYSQDFNSLLWKSTDNPYTNYNYSDYWSQGVTLQGWYLSRAEGSNTASFRIDNGAQYTAAAFSSYGYLTKNAKPNADKTDEDCLDRSLGSTTNTSSGAKNMMGVVIKNNTDKVIRKLAISYSGHLWKGAATVKERVEKLEFSYAVNPSIHLTKDTLNNTDIMDDVVLGTNFPTLDFAVPATNEAQGAANYGKMDGRDPRNMKEISASLPVLIPQNGTILLRWKDEAQAGESHNYGKAIDNLKIVAGF